MKKGFEMQFTWIFVIIAGAIIFAFLISIVAKQKDQAEMRDDIRIKEQLANIITIASSSSDAVNTFEHAPRAITFTCDEPDTSGFRVGAKGATQSLATNVVFAQQAMNGGQLYTWTTDWLLPYKGATFTYLSNKRTRYIFYRPTTNPDAIKIINWLLEVFPEQLEKVVVDENKIDDELVSKGYDAYVVVQVKSPTGNPPLQNGNPTEGPPPSRTLQNDACNRPGAIDPRIACRNSNSPNFKSSKEEVHLITIYPDEDNFHYGKIDFVRKGALSREAGFSHYYGREMLLGALFAPQKNLYQCAIRKGFERASLVTQINYGRVDEIDGSARSGAMFSSRPHCQYLYNYIKGTFDNKSYPFCGNVKIFDYITQQLAKNEDPQDTSQPQYNTLCPTGELCLNSGSCSVNTFQRLEDNANRLVREARDITLEGGCPYVY